MSLTLDSCVVVDYGKIDESYAADFAGRAPADDGPIYMLNLMKYREWADYGPGGEQGVTGKEADDRYAPVDVLSDLGASIVFFADVTQGTEDWDRVAVVKYPTRRSFFDMQEREDFKARLVHKDAGMARSIIMGTLPADELPTWKVERGQHVFLELWCGSESGPKGAGAFTVEGTIVGDGRVWTGAHWSQPLTLPTTGTDIPPALPGRQTLLLRPYWSTWI